MEIISDESEILLPKLKILTKVSKWDKYESVKRKLYDKDNNAYDFTFIRGYATTTKDTELYSYQEIDNIDFFIALIELHNKLSVEYTVMQADIEKNLSSKDIDLILSFCRSYGLPFWASSLTAVTVFNDNSNIKTGDTTSENLFRSIVPFSEENYFPVASFVVGLNSFYNDFLLLVGLNHWQDDINISPLIKGNEKRISLLLEINTDFYTPNLNPFVTYWNNINKCLALNCENIMHLAAYYICIMYQQKVFSFGYILKCKKCGNLFVSHQSRKRFCGKPCTRGAYYIANKRLQKAIEKTD
jgi:hypothetical protein